MESRGGILGFGVKGNRTKISLNKLNKKKKKDKINEQTKRLRDKELNKRR